MTNKVTQINKFKNDSVGLMQKSYERMLIAQSNFSNIAISRGIEIAKDNNVNLSESHILGVSFSGEFAIVAVLYKPIIAASPEDSLEPRQINVPVPAECLWVEDESWKDIYNEKLKMSIDAVEAGKETGEISKAINGAISN